MVGFEASLVFILYYGVRVCTIFVAGDNSLVPCTCVSLVPHNALQVHTRPRLARSKVLWLCQGGGVRDGPRINLKILKTLERSICLCIPE